MTAPRALLDAYARELWFVAGETVPREEFTPRAFAALRAVLDECDKCERGGTMMAPSVMHQLIADILGGVE